MSSRRRPGALAGRHVVAALACTLAPAVAGCGSAGSATTIRGVSPGEAAVPGHADPAAVRVIREWADTLRSGDVEAAARFFALPSTAENGPTALRITTLRDAVAFNRSLPCGARLIRAVSAGRFTTATFTLTERPGPGLCGLGTGSKARTSFVIHGGKIVEWRRVAIGASGGGGGGEAA